MEAYSSSCSSSKSSYLSQNSEEAKPKGLKHGHPFKSHPLLLHSVRKSAAKSWKKAPVAPMPPTPVKVYKVDGTNFRDLVQQLTCAPEFKRPQPHHQLLQSTERTTSVTSLDVSSPPMQNLSSRDTLAASPPLPACTNNWYQQYLKPEGFGKNSQDGAMTTADLLEMNLFSPTAFGNWCFYPPIMSPRM